MSRSDKCMLRRSLPAQYTQTVSTPHAFSSSLSKSFCSISALLTEFTDERTGLTILSDRDSAVLAYSVLALALTQTQHPGAWKSSTSSSTWHHLLWMIWATHLCAQLSNSPVTCESKPELRSDQLHKVFVSWAPGGFRPAQHKADPPHHAMDFPQPRWRTYRI